MPRRTQLRTVNSDLSDDSDNEVLAVYRNRSTNQRSNETQGLDETEIPADTATLLKNMVKLIIQYGVTGMLFKRADLVKNALGGAQKSYTVVFAQARNVLANVYGIEINQVLNVKGGLQYYLSNTHPVYDDNEYRKHQKRESTLLFLTLSYIYMKGGEVAETCLKNFLEKLNINCDGIDENFRNIPLIIDKFVKQHYICMQTVVVEGTTFGEKTNLQWGQRAEKEFDKKDVIKAVAMLMKIPPIAFINQYQEAFGEVNMDQIEELMNMQAATQQANLNELVEAGPNTAENTTMEVDEPNSSNNNSDGDSDSD